MFRNGSLKKRKSAEHILFKLHKGEKGMNNFIFENKRKYISGKDVSASICRKSLRCMGIRFCLPMVAARSRKIGVYEEVIAALGKSRENDH